jgi:hypothetical protein
MTILRRTCWYVVCAAGIELYLWLAWAACGWFTRMGP